MTNRTVCQSIATSSFETPAYIEGGVSCLLIQLHLGHEMPPQSQSEAQTIVQTSANRASLNGDQRHKPVLCDL